VLKDAEVEVSIGGNMPRYLYIEDTGVSSEGLSLLEVA
jgi:hypothetical protein